MGGGPIAPSARLTRIRKDHLVNLLQLASWDDGRGDGCKSENSQGRAWSMFEISQMHMRVHSQSEAVGKHVSKLTGMFWQELAAGLVSLIDVDESLPGAIRSLA